MVDFWAISFIVGIKVFEQITELISDGVKGVASAPALPSKQILHSLVSSDV